MNVLERITVAVFPFITLSRLPMHVVEISMQQIYALIADNQ